MYTAAFSKKEPRRKIREHMDREGMSGKDNKTNVSESRPSAIMRIQNAKCEMARKTRLRRVESIYKSTLKAPTHSVQPM
jgi:hypothetical protein